MWEVDFMTSSGHLSTELAGHVGELVATGDAARAYELAVLVESRVAPVSGGLSDEVVAVVTAVVAELPWMRVEARSEALFLLTQIAGSVAAADGVSVAEDAGSVLSAALPLFAGIAESGTKSEVAQCVDLFSICSSLSAVAAKRSVYYLSRIVCAYEGEIRASAQQELDEVRRTLT